MGTEVITYSRIGKEDIRFGRGTFEVVLADGRKVVLNEVDLGSILNTASLSSPPFPYWFNVQSYGENIGGGGNDAPAIQLAFDAAVAQGGGTIVFPMPSSGRYNIDTPLTCAPSSGQTNINFVGLGGSGIGGVVLNYRAAGGTALTIANNAYYTFENLRLQNEGTGAVGLHLTSLAAGSSHSNFQYKNVVLTGFTNDLKIGTTDNKAASDGVFINLECSEATTGILVQGPVASPNFSTIFHFIHLGGTGNTTTFVYNGPLDGNNTVFKFDSPSVGQNTLEFDFQAPCFANFYGAYSEHATSAQFIKSGSDTPTLNSAVATFLTIDSSYIAYPATPSNRICHFNQPGHYVVRNSLLATGSLLLGGFDGGAGGRKSQLTVERSVIVSAAAPIIYRAGSNTVWLVRHEQCGTTAEETINTLDDRTYLIKTTGVEYNFGTPIPWASTVAALDAL